MSPSINNCNKGNLLMHILLCKWLVLSYFYYQLMEVKSFRKQLVCYIFIFIMVFFVRNSCYYKSKLAANCLLFVFSWALSVYHSNIVFRLYYLVLCSLGQQSYWCQRRIILLQFEYKLSSGTVLFFITWFSQFFLISIPVVVYKSNWYHWKVIILGILFPKL